MHPIRISDLKVEPSPRMAGKSRLSVQVNYPGRFSTSETAWFEVPSEYASGLSRSGDAWLLAYLPLAITLGTGLVVDLPVDERLYGNAHALMDIWSSWYPRLSPGRLEVAASVSAMQQTGERTGLFFSGGVDSFYTLFRTLDAGAPVIDDLLVIHGFDIPVSNDRAFTEALRRAQDVGEQLNKTVIPITTNLRETRLGEASWSELAAGCLLGCAGLVLGQRYCRLLISGTLDTGHLRPHASHPDTDPLFSTGRTQFIHFGAELDRISKLRHLLPHSVAMRNLRVCYESDDGGNCGRCLKCVIVMAMLECMGALGETPAFEDRKLNLNLVRGTYISQGTVSFQQIREFASESGRSDVVEAVDAAFARTDRIDGWLQLRWVRWARERWAHNPWLRRATSRLRPKLYRLGRQINRVLP